MKDTKGLTGSALVRAAKANANQTKGRTQYSDQQRLIINHFFSKLGLIYGPKFTSTYEGTEGLNAIKREWANNILQYGVDQINNAFEIAKNNLASNSDYQWPNIARILDDADPSKNPSGGNAAAYIDYRDPAHPSNNPDSPEYNPKAKALGYESKAKRTGRAILEELKSADYSPRQKKNRANIEELAAMIEYRHRWEEQFQKLEIASNQAEGEK